MTAEDLIASEDAGRRCAVCHTGRRSRTFEVVHPPGREPALMCPACRARFGEALPEPMAQEAAPEPAPQPKSQPPKPRPSQAEDKLKRALRELPPGEHSTGRIAKAAGLNHAKVLARLHALEAAGEVQQVGKHWSTERPSTDLEAAFDRLQASTDNLRIVREPQRVS